ncbi:MAG: cytochrome P450 [Solirubrobacterales bacterium]
MGGARYPTGEGGVCPYPFYERWRSEQPVHELPERPGVFVVSTFAAIAEVARDPARFSSEESRTSLGFAGHVDTKSTSGKTMIESDPPEHKARRELCFKPVSPRRLPEYAPMIERHAEDLIDEFAARGSCEFVSEFAAPLPVRVTCSLLGLPPEEHARVAGWGQLEGAGFSWLPPERQQLQLERTTEMGAYLTELIEARHAEPRDDLISEIIAEHLRVDGEFDIAYLRAQIGALLAGGVITSAHMLANTLRLILESDGMVAELLGSPEQIGVVLEEGMRVESPVQWTPRLCREDTVLEGTEIPAGSHVLLMWGSANRDGDHFADPTAFDPHREDLRRHMAFGLGPHFCLGAPLARLEGRIALERLFGRLPSLRLRPGQDFEPIASVAFRGLQSLDLEFDPAPSA